MLPYFVRPAAVAVCVALCPCALAGPIDPPAGPVGPTMKTLDEVEPRTPLNATTAPSFGFGVFAISQPGSYYLTGNIVVPAGRVIGVRILSDNVTLDLNGFTISGNPNATAGVSVSVSGAGVTVRNGVIEDFTSVLTYGVDAAAATSVRIEDVVVRGATIGFRTGADSILERCIADGNGQTGFDLGSRSIARNCIGRGGQFAAFSFPGGGSAYECSTSQSARGFTAVGDLTLIDSSVNGTTVGNGVQVEQGAVIIRGCRVTDIGNWGIVIANGATAVVEDTVVTDTFGAGINYSSVTQGRIDGCVIRNTQNTGILATAGNTQVTNCIIDNAAGDGVNIVSGIVAGCVISNTDFEGIEADLNTRIEGNRIESPGANGIRVGDRCTIIGNTINDPPGGTPGSGYGINPTGAGNLVDGNHIALAVFQSFAGIVLGPGDGNTIVRNVMVNTSVAFTGTPSGSLLGPDDDLTSPWSNFTR